MMMIFFSLSKSMVQDPYLGGATWMAGYLATGACSPGGDSSLSCHVLRNSQVEKHMRISPLKEKSLAQRRRMRVAESRGEHFKGLHLRPSVPYLGGHAPRLSGGCWSDDVVGLSCCPSLTQI
ncbi:hypothetical protein H5410_034894 [Solanum commersonii]|uniref:Uncharacterized protein n=1 Tax=Solanum commersonii TaxID=4109 RepID=A0A9J5Y3H0_SOLCO|nr:hypothetical protein H5410_034894 [Solanum commersonii]